MAEESELDRPGDGGLTPRQRKFVAALVGPCRGNATQAYLKAGYEVTDETHATAAASRLLRRADVQAALSQALAKERLTPDWAKAGLAEIAAGTLAAFLEKDEAGQWRIDLDKAAEGGAIGQLAEYSEDEIPRADGGIIIKRRIKLHDRAKALGILLKLHGLIVDKQEHSGPNGGPIKTEVSAKYDLGKLSIEKLAVLEKLLSEAEGKE